MKIAIFITMLYNSNRAGITALDAIGPYESLARLPEVSVVFVAKTIGLIRTGNGFLGLHADSDIGSELDADVLIIPGGDRSGLVTAVADKELHAWIRGVDARSRWTCSVCTGSLILAAAGLLSNRKAATHWRAKEALGKFGVEYTGARVSIDGKYMTSAGVSAGIDMGLTLCSKLAGREVAEAVQLSMQYDPRPPFDIGDPVKSATAERVGMIENVLRS